MNSTVKYIAYCPNHNWEGMRRDDPQEAEKDLAGHKGWFPNESHSDAGVKEENEKQKNLQFNVVVIEDNEHSIKVALCTGQELTVPRSVISKFALVGKSKSEESIKQMALLSFNTSTLEGQLIYDLSKLLNGFYNDGGGSASNEKNISADEIKNTHTAHVQGTACITNFSYYSTDFNISGFALQRVDNCSVLEVIKTGNRELRIKHESIGGTQCGLGYGAKVYIDIW